MNLRSLVLMSVALPWGIGCTPLPDIADSVCGNAVQEATEECDTYAPEGQRCRGPTEVGACRFDCTPSASSGSATPDCPKSWACGADYICHQGTGEYQALGDFVPIRAKRVMLGDFDGDAHKDLLALGELDGSWQGQLQLVFFDDKGAPEDVIDPQVPVASPAIAPSSTESSTAHRREELVFSTMYGIGTFEASAERAALPVAYATQTLSDGWTYRMIRIRGTRETQLGDGMLILTDQGDSTWMFTANGSNVSFRLPFHMEDWLVPPLAANVIASEDSPCEEILFSLAGQSAIQLLEVCDASGKWLRIGQSEPRPVARLLGDATLGREMFSVSLNRDPFVDVVVVDNRGEPQLTFGRGDGSFTPDPANPDRHLGEFWPLHFELGDCANSLSLPTDFPLATGDLNADGTDDWIFPSGVWLSTSLDVDQDNERVRLQLCPSNQALVRWTVARVADLNGDQKPDIVAGSANLPYLDFLKGTGQSFLNSASIATVGPTGNMAVGDFDGDSVLDLALSQKPGTSSASSDSTEELLSISWGNRYGVPDPPLTVGRFGAIVQLAASNYFGSDTIEEIGLMARRLGKTSEQLSVFIGNSGRIPFSPLGLTNITADEKDHDSIALCSALGELDETAGYDVIVLAFDKCGEENCNHRFWLIPRLEDGQLGDARPGPVLPLEVVVGDSASPSLHAHLVAGDVDRNGRDEVLLLGGQGDLQTLGLYRVSLPADQKTWQPTNLVTLVSTADYRLLPESSPQLIDINADGFQDLLVLLGDPHGGNTLGVLLNEAGDFNFSELSTIDCDGADIRGFSALTSGKTPQLVVTTDAATCQVALGTSTPGTLRAERLKNVSGDYLPGGHDVALGDMTGDGLSDILLAVPGGVAIFEEAKERP